MGSTPPTVKTLSQRRAALWRLGLGLAAVAYPMPEARAVVSNWPSRTIRLLVAYPVGGVSDQVARDLAQQMSDQLSARVFVENRAGASGSIAMEHLMRSAPDGYTLGFAAVTALGPAAQAKSNTRGSEITGCTDRISHHQHNRLPTQLPSQLSGSTPGSTGLSLIPVAGVMHTPVLIAGTKSLRTESFGEMLRWSKARPDALRWATTGEGTTGHTVMEQISRTTGIRVVHVPYKGGGQQITDAIGGHFEVLSTNVAQPQLNAIAAGQLTAFAVGAARRLPVLPDIPTLSELGIPQANLDSLFGVFTPPQTPSGLVRRIHEEVSRAMHDSPLKGKLLAMSNIPFTGSSSDFAAEVLRRSVLGPRETC